MIKKNQFLHLPISYLRGYQNKDYFVSIGYDLEKLKANCNGKSTKEVFIDVPLDQVLQSSNKCNLKMKS